jgi:hypothetical protein
VQDNSLTYGGALRPLWISRLDDIGFEATAGDPLRPPISADAYVEGLHTLSACGDITLFDVKRIDRSVRGMALDLKRTLGGYDR